MCAGQDPNPIHPFARVMPDVRYIVPPGPGGAKLRHRLFVARFLPMAVGSGAMAHLRMARLGVLLSRIPQYPTKGSKGMKE
jgi:hypothetical protein